MTTMKLRLLAAVGILLGLLGGAGAGIYLAAADKPARTLAGTGLTTSPSGANDGQPAKEPKKEAKPADVKGTAAALDQPLGAAIPEGTPMGDLLERIESSTGLIVRVDVAAFRRVGAFGPNSIITDSEQFLKQLHEAVAILPRKMGLLPVRDVLTDALAQVRIDQPCAFHVRGQQLVIIPAFVPPGRPGANLLDPDDDVLTNLDPRIIHEQIYGGVVNVSAERKPLAEILADLRKQAGANIVLDPRCDAQEKKPVLTVELNDVRLYDALRVIADMAELRMVYAGNIYYVTTAANAKTFQPAVPRPQQGFPGPLGTPTIPPAPQPPPGP